MSIPFVKMHGLGNDFVIVDRGTLRAPLNADQVRYLADRRRGVGCDQLFVVDSEQADVDLGVTIYNADGSRAQQCGNGMRCLALYARRKGLISGDRVALAVGSRLIEAELLADDRVRVDMGVPELEPGAVAFVAGRRSQRYALRCGDETIAFGIASLGNPHAVLVVDRVNDPRCAKIASLMQTHERFPEGVNVGFMEICAPDHIRLRVFERGAGETPACGSGACAALVVGRDQGLLANAVAVDLPGGRLDVDWDGEGESVWLVGPATRVFEGTVELE